MDRVSVNPELARRGCGVAMLAAAWMQIRLGSRRHHCLFRDKLPFRPDFPGQTDKMLQNLPLEIFALVIEKVESSHINRLYLMDTVYQKIGFKTTMRSLEDLKQPNRPISLPEHHYRGHR